ncbi:hypothetical protein [Flexistipes sinusarabici]|uniref:hypothetical protein n=1 Tax=Flexistipes sinusarabici TaxID=2352 RepID=UPI00235386B4|nr:hypothetical protein [Flexistipes sinusarabici]
MKQQLLNSAKKLQQPSESAATEFSHKREQLAVKGSQLLSERNDMEKLVGKGNKQMSEDNNKNFARFMESMFSGYDPNVLVETVLWVFRAYRSHGFQTTYWAANLNIWIEMLKNEMSEETFNELYPFYNWLVVNIPVFVKLTDEDINS